VISLDEKHYFFVQNPEYRFVAKYTEFSGTTQVVLIQEFVCSWHDAYVHAWKLSSLADDLDLLLRNRC
jgi:hypothetical protein